MKIIDILMLKRVYILHIWLAKILLQVLKECNLNCSNVEGNTSYKYWKNEYNVYYGNKDAIRIIAAHILKEKMCGHA